MRKADGGWDGQQPRSQGGHGQCFEPLLGDAGMDFYHPGSNCFKMRKENILLTYLLVDKQDLSI